MSKHVLGSTGEEFDFALIGLSSPEDQYRVVSFLNDILGINLLLSEYVPMNLKMGRSFEFSLFRHIDKSLGVEFYLVPNVSNFEKPGAQRGGNDLFADQDVDERTRLIKELPKTDYFLLLKGELYNHHKFTVLKTLRDAAAFDQVQVIEPLSLNSRKNLVF